MNNSLTVKQFQFKMIMEFIFLVSSDVDNVTICDSVHKIGQESDRVTNVDVL